MQVVTLHLVLPLLRRAGHIPSSALKSMTTVSGDWDIHELAPMWMALMRARARRTMLLKTFEVAVRHLHIVRDAERTYERVRDGYIVRDDADVADCDVSMDWESRAADAWCEVRRLRRLGRGGSSAVRTCVAAP